MTLARFRARHAALSLIRYPLGRRASQLHDEYLESKRSETKWLIEQLSMYGHIARKAAALFILAPCLLFAQEPPPVPHSVFLRELGRPGNHYSMPITLTVTQTITTVYELDFMRYIRTRLGPSNVVIMKTNYAPMIGTNVVSCVTNSSPIVPE